MPPPESDSASAIDETTNDFSGLILASRPSSPLASRQLGLGLFRRRADRHDLHARARSLPHGWTGMKVTEFFIGFDPTWSFRKGETEYGVKGIPAGAYVRIIGMNNLDPVEPGDERSYRIKRGRARCWSSRRLCDAFIMAIVLLAVLAPATACRTMTVPAGLTHVRASAAAGHGIEPGDVMLSVGVRRSAASCSSTISSEPVGELTEFTWEHNGEVITDSVVIGSRLRAPTPSGSSAGILAIEGTDVTNWTTSSWCSKAEGEFVDITVDPVGEQFLVMIVEILDITSVENPTVGFFGVAMSRCSTISVCSARHGMGRPSARDCRFRRGAGAVLRAEHPETLDRHLGGGADLTTATDVAERREINGRALDIRNPDEERILRFTAPLDRRQCVSKVLNCWRSSTFSSVAFNLAAAPARRRTCGHRVLRAPPPIGGRKHEVDHAGVAPAYAVSHSSSSSGSSPSPATSSIRSTSAEPAVVPPVIWRVGPVALRSWSSRRTPCRETTSWSATSVGGGAPSRSSR